MGRTPGGIDAALGRFDFRAAGATLWSLVEEANRFVMTTRPWELARSEGTGDAAASARLDEVLWALLAACHALAHELEPFLPAASTRIGRGLDECDPALGRRLFSKAGVTARSA